MLLVGPYWSSQKAEPDQKPGWLCTPAAKGLQIEGHTVQGHEGFQLGSVRDWCKCGV